MNLLKWMRHSERNLSVDQWIDMFTYDGLAYPAGLNQTLRGNAEKIEGNFQSLVAGAYKSNGIVFACMLTRLLLFSEARFQYQRMRGGRPGELFGTPALRLLEEPWPGATTGDLLARAIQDADIAGNFFATTRFGRIRRMRPDWVTIFLASERDPDDPAGELDAEIVGYGYMPSGDPHRAQMLNPNEVMHFAPIPDPAVSYRGMSWLVPVIREIIGDTTATDHKTKLFENGATPNMVVTFDPGVKKEQFDTWVKLIEEGHTGIENAYKTLYLGGGANAEVVGANLRQLDFKTTQGAGETRIAAASGIHPVIVGLSEGLQGSSLNSGNFSAGRRLVADRTLRPLWRNFAGSATRIVSVPPDARLWYDDRDIPFVREDKKDEAEIHQIQAQAIKGLVEAGFEAQAAVEAVITGDFSRLSHSGLFSVQLQPANSNGNDEQNGAREFAEAVARSLGDE